MSKMNEELYADFVVRRLSELGIYGDTVDEVRHQIVTSWALENERSLRGVAGLREFKARPFAPPARPKP